VSKPPTPRANTPQAVATAQAPPRQAAESDGRAAQPSPAVRAPGAATAVPIVPTTGTPNVPGR
jgi:hypothetical protein